MQCKRMEDSNELNNLVEQRNTEIVGKYIDKYTS